MPVTWLPWWRKALCRRALLRGGRLWRVRLSLEALERRIVFSSDTLLTASPLNFNSFNSDQATHFLAAPGEVDLYRVSLDMGARVNATVSAQTAGSGLVSLLRIFDAGGRQVALDAQEGGDPQLTFQAAVAGDYYVGVSSAPNDAYDPMVPSSGTPGGTTGLYTLNLRESPLAPGAPVQEDLTSSSFRLGTDAAVWADKVPVAFTVENRGASAADATAQVQLLLSDNNTFRPSSHIYTFAQTFSLAGLAAGQQYSSKSFTVTLPDPASAEALGFSPSGPVFLGVSITDDPTQDASQYDKSGVHRGADWESLTIVTPVTVKGHNRSLATAFVLNDLNSTVAAALSAGQQGWYEFTVTTPGQLRAFVSPSSNSSVLAPHLALYGGTGQLLFQSDGPIPGASFAQLEQHLDSGTYYLSVFAPTGSGDYELTTAFAPGQSPLAPVTVGSSPHSVAAADVNGDGNLDTIVTNNASNTVSVLLGNGDGTFQTQQSYPVGKGANDVVATDVNGDGRIDLIVSNFSDKTVSILLGNGDGTFQAAKAFAVGSKPTAVAVADLNGDGKPDIVTANYGSDTVSVLLGNGDGTLQTQQPVAVGSAPQSVTVADVNGDGMPDLIVANRKSDTVSVLLGNGNGSFEPQQTFKVGSSPRFVAVVDVNGDGELDIVVANGDDKTVSVLLGRGAGAFQAQQTFAVGTAPQSVTVADVNGDGKLDVVTANYSDNTVSVLLGDGDGTFQPRQTLSAGSGPESAAVADFNGDGRVDLAVVDSGTSNQGGTAVSVLLGNGDGSFQTQPGVLVGARPRSIATADLNGDGISDFITANYASNTVSVLLGNGDGSFQPQQTLTVGSRPVSVTAADLNGDGRPDLVVANEGSNTVSVLLGNGNGSFHAQSTFLVGKEPESVAVADVNGDGKPDLIVANFADNTIGVLLGNGDGTFHPQQVFRVGTGPFALAVADVNGDGKADIVVANLDDNTVSALLGNGDGTFQAQRPFKVGSGPKSVAVADVDGDGKPDIVVGNHGDDTVGVLLGDGTGSFQSQQTFRVDAGPIAVAVVDINGDRRPDIVTANYGANTVSVLLGDGRGSFQTQQPFSAGSGPVALAVADVNGDGHADIITANYGVNTATVLLAGSQDFSFQSQSNTVDAAPNAVAIADVNGDGKPDMVVANYDSNTVSVLLGNGNGTFQSQQTFEVGSGPEDVLVTDVNGDGIPDIVTANYGDNTVSVLLGNGDGTFQKQKTFSVGKNPSSVAAADVNGDGIPDLIVANYTDYTVSVLLGNGKGIFPTQQTFPVGQEPRSVAVKDVDGDGKPDIVTANQSDNTVSVLLNNTPAKAPTVAFAAQMPLSVGSLPQSVAVADLNGDGIPDLIIASYGDNTVGVLLGKGGGAFQDGPDYLAQHTFPVGSSPYSMVVTDVNADGVPDIVTANYLDDNVSVLLGNGDGTFRKQKTFSVGSSPQYVAVADLNGDSKPDIVTANFGADNVSLLLGNGDGTFQTQQTISVRPKPRSVTVADLNRDGKPDLIAADRSANTVNVLLGNGDSTFQSELTLGVGKGPKAVAAADLSGDGIPDIVTANYDAGTVSVLLGNGDGTFQTQQTFPVGSQPESLAVADLNGDGFLDIITANYGSGTVSVLFGNGDGTFQAQQIFAVGPTPEAVAVADLNGDGKPDIVIANYKGNTISVLLNTSTRGSTTASFAAQAPMSVGLKPIAVAVADLNGDGNDDVVTANYTDSTVSVLLGNGDSTFGPQQTFAVGSKPKSLAIADVNGDGKPDLITANYGTATVSVLVGNGTGTFQPQQAFPVGSEPKSVAVAAVSGDGRPDIITANYGDDTLSVLRNVKGNAFRPAAAGGNGVINTPLLADLNGDHIPDSVILNNAGDILFRRGLAGGANQFAPFVKLQALLGITRPARDLAVVNTGTGLAIAAADANFDSTSFAYTVSLYTIAADGSVTRSTAFATPFLPNRIAAADLTGNGLDDLVVLNALNNSVEIAFQEATNPGHFSAPITVPVGLTPSDIALVDVVDAIGVGLPDIVVSDQSSGAVTVLLNNATLPFVHAESFQAGTASSGVAAGSAGPAVNSLDQSVSLAAGSFTSTAGNDLVVVNRGAHSFTVLPNDASGGFSDPQTAFTTSTSAGLTVNDQPGPVVTADFHGTDGLDTHRAAAGDLAILMEDRGEVWIYTNNGDGTFTLGQQIPVGGVASGLTVVAGNGPGVFDLLVGSQFGDILRLVGTGDGTFTPPPSLTGDSVPLDVQTLRGNVPDVLLADQRTNTITVQTPTANGTAFTPIQTLADDPNSHLAPGAVQWARLDGTNALFDAVVMASGSNSVLVYHTTAVDAVTGKPTFAPPISYFVGTDPVAVTIQDINGDRVPDMLVANKGSNDVSVLIGSVVNGIWIGTPGPRLKSDGTGPSATTLVDVNGDKVPDLVVTNSGSNTVTVLPGIGTNGVGTGFFQDNHAVALDVPGAPIGGVTGGLLATTQGVFRIDLNTGNVTQVFASTNITAISVSADGVVLGLANGSLEFLTPDSTGRLAEALIFRDAGLTDPSAVELVTSGGQSDIYATSAGLDRVFVFALSEGIAVPGFTTPFVSREQHAELQPISEAGLFLVANIVTNPFEGNPTTDIALDERSLTMMLVVDDDSIIVGEGDGATGNQHAFADNGPTSPLNDYILGVDDGIDDIRLQIREQRGRQRDDPQVPDSNDDGPLSALDCYFRSLAGTGPETPGWQPVQALPYIRQSDPEQRASARAAALAAESLFPVYGPGNIGWSDFPAQHDREYLENGIGPDARHSYIAEPSADIWPFTWELPAEGRATALPETGWQEWQPSLWLSLFLLGVWTEVGKRHHQTGE